MSNEDQSALTGADPARVHWVHVQLSDRVHVQGVLNARSTLNV